MRTISKAPLRLGLAGGGTDVSPYTERYGGEVVNAAISLFAAATLEDLDEHKLEIHAQGEAPVSYLLGAPVSATKHLPYPGGTTDLGAVVFNHFLSRNLIHKGLRLSFRMDVPVGSGLGTSSTLVVAILGAFTHHFGQPVDHHQIAELAYVLERKELGLAGGRQDQYAATFGGFHHLHFLQTGQVEMTTLKLSPAFLHMLEQHLVLYYTAHSRHSSGIIEEQRRHVRSEHAEPLHAMHMIREQAAQMRTALQDEDLERITGILNAGFDYKKKMARGISTEHTDKIHVAALRAGARAGKISGAGGGGFMFFLRPPELAVSVSQALHTFGGREYPFRFIGQGLSISQDAYGQADKGHHQRIY